MGHLHWPGFALRGAVGEFAATLHHVVRYVPGEFDAFAVRRVFDRPAHRTYPVLFVHGLMGNQSAADGFGTDLSSAGYDVHAMTYRSIGVGIEDAARQVADAVESVRSVTGADRIHVIAHSLGGIAIRAAAARHGAAGLLGGVVTLGTPHQGSPVANPVTRLAPRIGRLVGQLSCGSSYLRDLDRAAQPGQALTWTAVYSPFDHLVPGTRGALSCPGYLARNVAVEGVGHLALTTHRGVLAAVRDALDAADVPAAPLAAAA